MFDAKDIRDFGPINIQQWKLYYDDEHIINYEVWTSDYKLVAAFSTARAAKKFCKKWMLKYAKHDAKRKK